MDMVKDFYKINKKLNKGLRKLDKELNRIDVELKKMNCGLCKMGLDKQEKIIMVKQKVVLDRITNIK